MHSDWFIVVGGLAHDLATNMLYLMHELTSMPRPLRSPAGVEARACALVREARIARTSEAT